MAHRPTTMASATRAWIHLPTYLGWLLVFFLATSSVCAQYRFDSWTTENGLPNNWIMAIHQTRDGYLWLTTQDGVARFDGVQFRVFNKVNTPSLTSNWFSYRALWEDAQGNLWMGTHDGGVIRYHNGILTSLTTKNGLPSNYVFRIDEDATGTIWIFTASGVVRWKNGHLVLPRSKLDRSLDAYLTAPKNLGTDGRLFGFWRLKAGEWQRFAYGHWSRLPLPAGLHDPVNLHIAGIAEDSGRRLWYSLENRPHEYYCVSNGRLTVIPDVPDTLATQICCRDREGRIWMGNHYGAVGLWANGRFTPLPGIATSNVFQIMEDREGNLWIATLDRGLYRLRKEAITAYHRRAGVQQANVIGPMLQDRSGAVWFGSGGLTRFKNGQFATFYRPHHSHRAWDGANLVDALYQDRDGSLWVHMWDGSILRFKDGQFHSDKALSARVKGRLNVILRDRAGDLWFGGEQGLYRVHDHRVTHFTARDGLPENTVNIIEEDGDGKLWIGTSGGLVQYVSGKLVPVVGVQGVCVEALYQDKARVWWVGTLNDGLYRLASGANGLKVTRYTTAEGLYSNRVDDILEDGFGYLWLSSDSGLYRVRKRDLNDLAEGRNAQVISTHFGESDGLPGECSGVGQGMAFKAHDGRLWFATQNGIAVIDPRAIQVNRLPPPVMIEGCLVDLHPVACQQGLRMRPGQANLEIDYTALSFIKSGQIRFNYKLEGLDRDWVDAGTRRSAYYSHLPPGHYVFKVTAANSDGVWNTRGKSMAVIVLPPFYQAWWFLTIVSLIVAGAVILTWLYRVSQLKRAHAAQQAFSRELIASQESERKRIAAELHDSLGQHLVVIKNLALMSLNDGSDGTPQPRIEEISAEASHALSEVKEISYNLRPYQLDRIGLTKAVEAIVKKAKDATAIAFTAEIDSIDDVFPKDSEINFYRIVQECVNNLMKHSRATQANLAMRRTEGELLFMIRDNGIGFSPGASRATGGFGLVGIFERAQLLGGKPVIQSAPGEGTTLSIKIPLGDGRHGK